MNCNQSPLTRHPQRSPPRFNAYGLLIVCRSRQRAWRRRSISAHNWLPWIWQTRRIVAWRHPLCPLKNAVYFALECGLPGERLVEAEAVFRAGRSKRYSQSTGTIDIPFRGHYCAVLIARHAAEVGSLDGSRFDDVIRALTIANGSRRGTLRLVASSAIGLLAWRTTAVDTEAKNALQKCKKIRDKKKRKKCIKKAKKRNPEPGVELCDGVACPENQKCCPDERCGQECCDNGRACNVVCSGPTGNDYCCDASRPVAICGGCWEAGSIQCEIPGHCCGPNQVCCGDDHCCDKDTQECRLNCGGVEGSNSCCGIGSVLCCPDGIPG